MLLNLWCSDYCKTLLGLSDHHSQHFKLSRDPSNQHLDLDSFHLLPSMPFQDQYMLVPYGVPNIFTWWMFQGAFTERKEENSNAVSLHFSSTEQHCQDFEDASWGKGQKCDQHVTGVWMTCKVPLHFKINWSISTDLSITSVFRVNVKLLIDHKLSWTCETQGFPLSLSTACVFLSWGAGMMFWASWIQSGCLQYQLDTRWGSFALHVCESMYFCSSLWCSKQWISNSIKDGHNTGNVTTVLWRMSNARKQLDISSKLNKSPQYFLCISVYHFFARFFFFHLVSAEGRLFTPICYLLTQRWAQQGVWEKGRNEDICLHYQHHTGRLPFNKRVRMHTVGVWRHFLLSWRICSTTKWVLPERNHFFYAQR